MRRSWARALVIVAGVVIGGSTVVGGAAATGHLGGMVICCGGGGGTTYKVTFTESGLPSGTNWWVTMNGQNISGTSSSLVFYESNGSYTYVVGGLSGYTSRPQAGLVGVAGAAVNVGVTFVAAYYEVSFKETGLPSGTPWWVALDGGAQAESTTDTVMIPAANGVHTYQVYPPQNYPTAVFTSSPSSGSITVAGAPLTGPSIKFTSLLWSVKIVESGLAKGTAWQGYLNNSTSSRFLVSTNTTLFFNGTYNGVYTWYVFAVPGYTGGNIGTTVTVSGAQQKVNVNFS